MSEEFKTVNEIEEYLKAALEQRKNDVIKSAGAVSSAKEFIVVHNQFLEKARNELQKMTNDGKITAEIANFVLAWLGKSHTVAIEYSTSSKSRHDIKSGETLAIDATSRLIKNVKERELKKHKENTTQQETNTDSVHSASIHTDENKSSDSSLNSVDSNVALETLSIEEPKKKKKEKNTKSLSSTSKLKNKNQKHSIDSDASSVEIKEKKTRPDEKGKLAETIKRMKTARSQISN